MMFGKIKKGEPLQVYSPRVRLYSVDPGAHGAIVAWDVSQDPFYPTLATARVREFFAFPKGDYRDRLREMFSGGWDLEPADAQYLVCEDQYQGRHPKSQAPLAWSNGIVIGSAQAIPWSSIYMVHPSSWQAHFFNRSKTGNIKKTYYDAWETDQVARDAAMWDTAKVRREGLAAAYWIGRYAIDNMRVEL